MRSLLGRSGLSLLLCLPLALTAAPRSASAQLPTLDLPDASPAASRTQVLAATTLEVRWSRPGVKGRAIWGALVPWGEPWRIGANENTTFATDGPLLVAGQPLAAGTYGLHLLPVENGPWTLVFSRESGAWGSYGYDQADDALRVAVTPREAPFEERLDLRFDDLAASTATFALRWEHRELAVPIAVPWPDSVLTSIRRQLRGRAQFSWFALDQAAAWSLANGGDLDEALRWVDASISRQRNFTNLRTRAAILEHRGDATTAAALREEAAQLSTESELDRLGKDQLRQGKTAEAIATLRRNADRFPKSWRAWEGLAMAHAETGDHRLARTYYERAIKLAPAGEDQRLRASLAALAP